MNAEAAGKNEAGIQGDACLHAVVILAGHRGAQRTDYRNSGSRKI